MPFQAYNHMLIADQPIKNLVVENVTIGYEFKVQYPSYRGTFLSCIEALSFRMDDVEIPREKIYFLSECFKEYWFVLDFATIRVMQSGGLPLGEHKVSAYIKHRIPYTGYFGQYMVMDADESRVLPVE